jgi:hypothetical protein
MIEKSECPNCAASVEPGSDKCSFCGQWFKKKVRGCSVDAETFKENLKRSLGVLKVLQGSPANFSFGTGSHVVGYYAGPTSILGKPGKTTIRQN